MAASRWMFTKEQLQNTPSRKCGIDADKELSYRQQAANLIQDMGQRLGVTQLCINTAIVYMHRFYMLRSFTRFPRNDMAPACLFLAAKVEEQPRKLEHVIKVVHTCLNRDNTSAPDSKTEAYLEQAQQLVINENILLQTLGFEVTVDHPHTHVVKVTSLVKASKDLSQTSYYLATNSLHMTMFCLQYKPTEIACACIYLASKWSMYKIPRSNEGREWWQYVDPSITLDLLEEIKTEFLNILDKYPSKLKKRIMGGWKGTKEDGGSQSSPQHCDPNRPLSSTSAAYHRHTNHDRNEINDSNKHLSEPSRHSLEVAKHGEEYSKQDSESKPGIDSNRHVMESSKRSSEISKHGIEVGKHAIEVNKYAIEVNKQALVTSKHLPDSGKHPPFDPKHLVDRDGKVEHRRVERKDADIEKKSAERKDMAAHLDKILPPIPVNDQKLVRKEERHDIHSAAISSHKKEGHPRPVDTKSVCHERKDIVQVKKEVNFVERPHQGGPQQVTEPQLDIKIKSETVREGLVKNEPAPSFSVITVPSQSGVPNNAVEMRKIKSETAIHYKDYLKRKEQQKLEDKFLKQKAMENCDNINKTFSEGNSREHKIRPLKLDISLPLPENSLELKTPPNNKDNKERPYEVNIKSPIKPHFNITVKSPIKSSDLKRPKLEIPKVQITPEKDGSDPFSVNINTDPNIRKLLASVKPEADSCLADSDEAESLTVKVESYNVKDGSNTNEKSEIDLKSETDIKSKIKQEMLESHEHCDSAELEISLKPEHSTAPNVKIKELGFDPDLGLTKYSIKLEKGSGKCTPVPAQIKPDTGSGTNTPIKLKLQGQSGENSPLKIKISTKGLTTDGDQSSSKHASPHKHKHKDKHKSHKHVHNREKHREKHREKSSTGTADVNGPSQSLKLNIKLSDLQGHASSSQESWSVAQKHIKHVGKHDMSAISDPAVGKSNSAGSFERQQPWSVSDLITKPKTTQPEQLMSRKRRHTPADTQNNDEQSSKPKAIKMGMQRLRRSSSSHSVVSMEMSDGEEGHTNGPTMQAINPPLVVNQLQESLHSLIAQAKEKVQSLQMQQQHEQMIRMRSHMSRSSPHVAPNLVDRQQSGFDLDSMMWVGSAGVQPPLPPNMPTPPPPPPDQIRLPPDK